MNSFALRSFAGVEVALQECIGHTFCKHAHDEFVISTNIRGREAIWLDGKSFEASVGDLTLYNPGQTQAGGAKGASWAYAGLYVDPQVVQASLGLSVESAFLRPVLSHPGLANRLTDTVIHALDAGTTTAEAEEAVMLFLGDLFAVAGDHRPSASRHLPPGMTRVAQQLVQASALPSLGDLAATEGMTPVQLVRAFSKAYGLPPLAWLYNERLKAARLRLARGEDIASLAIDLGFADQAHLTRRFKAMYGVTPGVWQRRLK
ncbi:AraC family transcriptional regulator [Pseudomonas wadenswilerensis]